ncbi:DNA polymerase III subunit epsilon [Robertkochia marina]|uniref:DNA polymerase III subunit epsilon n=1 Tax=Robertkochia marina TaxID=1227945 RepID=A0A4S3M463_9FLAO|nr:exonuclease domain-containing protein [Robertkochia marina]THD69680.1 DNA polymerase III subunit epsilon [Robertkochia marina]TRZ46974.1 DNA polymerase III subunit epsilon [Robertkochia marina]
MQFAIVDIETTGLAGRDNRVTEIAVVIHDGKQKLEEFHSLVNPGVPIAPFVTRLTGIDDSMVSEAPEFSELASTLLSLMEDRIFVAHNVQFDYQVLRSEFKALGYDFYRKKLCTVRWSRKVFPGLYSYSLGKLCASLNIELNDRHRAKGDTDATVILFEKLMAADRSEWYLKMLSRNSGTGTLPSLLPRSDFEKLPETPGVYYFKDRNQKVIYVGKAVNIKKRVLGHFYDKTSKEIALCRETACLDYTETGSELIALLKESAEIKAIYPKYNRAQKRTNKGYAITSYRNRKGIIQLGYNSSKLVNEPLRTFFNVQECIAELERLCEAYQLCPRFTQLQSQPGPCDHYKLTSCKGVCSGQESAEAYNERVLTALEELRMGGLSVVISLKGREPGERGLVLVDRGVYKGYGFISEEETIDRWESFAEYIQPREHNSDVMRLIDQHLRSQKKLRLYYPEDNTLGESD